MQLLSGVAFDPDSSDTRRFYLMTSGTDSDSCDVVVLHGRSLNTDVATESCELFSLPNNNEEHSFFLTLLLGVLDALCIVLALDFSANR